MRMFPIPSYREVAHDRTACPDSYFRELPGTVYHKMPLANRPAFCPECGGGAAIFTAAGRTHDEYYRDGVYLMTVPAWWADIREMIHVNPADAIVYDSRLERVRPPCDVDRLLRCVEDALLGDDDLTDDHWDEVETLYFGEIFTLP